MSKNHYQKLSKSQWATLRRQVIRRDGFRCVLCGRVGKFHVDHVKPLFSGGSETDPDNLRTLCRTCHVEKNRREHEERNPKDPQVEAWENFIKSAFEGQ